MMAVSFIGGPPPNALLPNPIDAQLTMSNEVVAKGRTHFPVSRTVPFCVQQRGKGPGQAIDQILSNAPD